MTPKIPSSNSTSATPMNRQIAARPTLLGFVQNFSIKTKLILGILGLIFLVGNVLIAFIVID